MDITYFNALMVGISLVTVSLAMVGLMIGLLYIAVRLSHRVSDIEANQEAFQARIAKEIEELLGKGQKNP